MNVEKLTEDQAVLNYDYQVEVTIYDSGIQVIPTAATLTVKGPDGSELLSAVTMAIAAAGTLTYTVPLAKIAALGENYVLEVEYTASSVKNRAVFLFDVVRNALHCSVVDDDLKSYFPQIADELPVGDGMPTNYAGQITEAFRVVKRQIKDKGRRPHMLIDGGQVRELVIIKTLESICFFFAKDPEDIWWKRYEKYADRYSKSFEALAIVYDEDESGTVETDEKAESLGQVTLER